MRTGPTNMYLQGLIRDLKVKSQEENAPIWKRVARELERPTRSRRIVNLSRINRYTKEGETVLVPGKVLGTGTLDHKVTVAAYDFSDTAKAAIEAAKGQVFALNEFIKADHKGKRVRIIG